MLRPRAFTMVELLVVIAVIAILIGTVLPALTQFRNHAAATEDAAQLLQIHGAMCVFAGGHNGVLPTPGLINRSADTFLGAQGPGIGVEDVTKNTSRHLYSFLIAQNYFTPHICIGPTEVNPVITRYRTYRYDQYDPAADVYWDGDAPTGTTPNPTIGFRADITNTGISHTSYYHLALLGKRKRAYWTSHTIHGTPRLANRAPRAGADRTQASHTRSQTLLLHGSKSQWAGNVVYADNHLEMTETFYPSRAWYDSQQDNIFAREFTDSDPQGFGSGDTFLCMTKSIVDLGHQHAIVEYHEGLLGP